MGDELADFHRDFLAEVRNAADSEGTYRQDAFFELVGEILMEAGELDAAERCHDERTVGRKSLRIDGFGGDPRDADGVLSLILCDFVSNPEPERIGGPDLAAALKRGVNFLTASRQASFRDSLEETSDVFSLVDMIDTTWSHVVKIKIVLVTNRERKTRTDAKVAGEIAGIPVTYNVWDLDRLRRFRQAGQTREDLVVRFAKDFEGAVPVLRASGENDGLESYVAVVEGRQLAAIYEKWGTRLLESNVRSFLQARGKVNKGIRKTISDDPGMFFSYNNGITATAERVTIEGEGAAARMTEAENLQIVNGGQTTASLHAALRDHPESLGRVFVQMKLTVVPANLSEEVVPSISEFANSQNKVTAADFFSNHPFHVEMEKFSRQVLAPAGPEGDRETKWFYERARGQFADARGKLTIAQRKKFDLEFPKAQFLTKTDLAKYVMTWRMHPDIVSHGAQKTFTGPNAKTKGFAGIVGEEWQKSSTRFDETWFRRAVAQSIIFRRLEKAVPRQEWYRGGYRANIITYGIAKLVRDVEGRGMEVDLDTVWRAQSVSAVLENAMLSAARAAQEVITNPLGDVRNLSEWAKKPACWKMLAERTVDYPEDLDDVLVHPEDAKAVVRGRRGAKALDDSIASEGAALRAGAAFWTEAGEWGRTNRCLTLKEHEVLGMCAAMPKRMPSPKQITLAFRTLVKMQDKGWEGELPS